MSKYNKEELEQLILKDNLSYEEIGRKFGVSGNAIKKVAKRFGIKLPIRRKINQNETFNRKELLHFCEYCGNKLNDYYKGKRFCNNRCQFEYQYEKYIRDWKDGKENGIRGRYDVSNYIRRYLFEKHNCKCEKCGWGEINETTGNIPLQIHHKDGDCTNNCEENLQLLCPNCHSLTETFGNSNKNSKRIYRKQKGNC